jgi:hypothetical protein
VEVDLELDLPAELLDRGDAATIAMVAPRVAGSMTDARHA